MSFKFKEKLKDLKKKIWQFFSEIITTILSFVNKWVEPLGKISKFVSIILFLVLTILILCYVISRAFLKDPFLEDISLSKKSIESGYNIKQVTNEIRDNAQSIINNYASIEEIKDLDELIIRNNLNTHACTYTEPNSKDINLNVLNVRREDIDTAIPKTNIRTAELIKIFKEFFNLQNATFKASIIENDSNYKVKFSVVDKEINESLDAKDFNEAKDKISLLIVKYSNPAIYALTTSFNDYEGIIKSFEFAIQNYKEYKNNSLSFSLMGHSILVSNRYYISLENYNEAEKRFNQAIALDNDDAIAILGNISVKEAKSKSLDATSFAKMDSENEALLLKIIEEKKYTPQAYKLLTNIYSRTNLNKAIFFAHEGTKKFKGDFDLKIFYSLLLIKNNQHESAAQYIKSELDSNILASEYDIANISKINYLKNLLHSLVSDPINMELLKTNAKKMNHCDFVDWSKNTFELTRSSPNRLKILDGLASQFQAKESQGMREFDFYSLYAAIQKSRAELRNDPLLIDDSIRLSKKTLDFLGDHAMSYNNIGQSYYDSKNFANAENYFKKSVDIRKTPLNTSNYLTSIYVQNEYGDFIKKYNELESVVEIDDQLGTKEYIHYGISNCKLNEYECAADVYKRSVIIQQKFKELNIPFSNEIPSNLAALQKCLSSEIKIN